MTGIDLRELMHERSGSSTDNVLDHLRLAGVRAKVVTRRRRRMAAGAIVAAVAVAGTVSWAALPGAGARRPAETGAVRQIEGFPEYADGTHVVATAVARLPVLVAALSYTPKTKELVLFTRCFADADPASEVTLAADLKINNKVVSSGGCTDGSVRLSSPGLAEAGLRVGEPAMVSMTITHAEKRLPDAGGGPVTTAIPARGEFGLAVGERVPFADYPLPARPARLPPLGSVLTRAMGPGVVTLRADSAEPDRPVQRVVSWRTLNDITVVSQTPGTLRILVDGVEVGVHEAWDYEQGETVITGDWNRAWKREFNLVLRPGQAVTVRVEPEHVTGDWVVLLGPA